MASSREKEGDVLSQDSGSQRTLAHQREEERQESPPTPISEPHAPGQAPLTPLTVSASFSLLLAISEALFQPAAGRKTPGSQIAHKSINLSQSKSIKSPRVTLGKKEKRLCFVVRSLFIHWEITSLSTPIWKVLLSIMTSLFKEIQGTV